MIVIRCCSPPERELKFFFNIDLPKETFDKYFIMVSSDGFLPSALLNSNGIFRNSSTVKGKCQDITFYMNVI